MFENDEKLAEFFRLQIQEVRKHHISKTDRGITFCTNCVDESEPNDFAVWPCPTIQALNNEA
jgi:hypothetical protein